MYMGEQKVVKNGLLQSEAIVRSTMIAHAPMTLIYDSEKSDTESDTKEDEPSEQATKLNAEAHLNFFNIIFPYYKQEFSDWVVCSLETTSP